jgi:2,3-diaminopropionate biosynthesis protein SbnB
VKRGDVLLLGNVEVERIFAGRERTMIDAVRAAYLVHEQGDVSLPNCPFLRFPGDAKSRIIAKPAYLGGKFQVAGIKWVASFPANTARGLDRASATLILNSPETGAPTAIMEGSGISAYRTAASAALAAEVLRGRAPAAAAGLIGCGLINFHVLRLLLIQRPEIEEILLYDKDAARAERFAQKCASFLGGRKFRISECGEDVVKNANLISLATTATVPHLSSASPTDREAVILHISLRDFTPGALLAADNVVDDVEHSCSNATSVHLAAQQKGNRDFVRTTLGAILAGKAPARVEGVPVIFSPFGLGILDVALAHAALGIALEQGIGTVVAEFLPAPWDAA